MSGDLPRCIKKGRYVLYKGTAYKVLDYFWTCPCATGKVRHHPKDDLLMVILEGIGRVPYDWRDFKPSRKKVKE